MNNTLKKVLLVLMVLLTSVILIACNNTVGEKTFTIEFVNSDIASLSVKDGEKVARPEEPIKTDYIFDDWYADENFDVVFDFNTAIKENTKIYASFYIKIPALLKQGESLEHNQISTTVYYAMGTIKSIVQTEYGNLTITDGENEIFVYGVYSKDGAIKYGNLEQRPVVGDIIYIKGPLKKYNESIELNNTRLIKMKVGEKPDFNIDDYQQVSIDIARSKAVDTKVLVQGVVTTITYANGKKPCGAYLVDETNSIYIYDGNIAASVSVGDRISVAGVRDNFILESEIANAQLHGYQGAIQIVDGHLIEKDSGNYQFNKDWIETKTIKEILDTDFKAENITGTIFKVNAFINKVEGTGFTNYYFNDLDNQTGSYTYSMNNGSDFSWLDQYDGQLRTVYLSVINAKANPAGISYRFQPIEIGDVYQYDKAYNPKLAVIYYGVGQFAEQYAQGNSPDFELITTVDAPWLDVSGINLSYHSSDESVAYFENDDDKLIFKTGSIGTATITISSTDGTNQYSQDVVIKVYQADDVNYLAIIDAILVADDTEVTIKGIVAASLVNQSGVFIIDDTGIVAVRMSGTELAKLNLGNEVVIKGIKTHVRGSNDPSVSLGQLVVDQAEVIVNYLGNNQYNDSFFITGKSLKDLLDFDKLEEHSTTVYVIEAEIIYSETPYYTRYELKDGDTTTNIYSSSGSQLSFLAPYQGKRVTVEYISVNWNGNRYVAGIVSIIVDGQKIASNQNFK